jgi:SAM-dependent MidA family methyltransferase
VGAKGDFITAPEISQMFGEILALWYINWWQSQNEPKPIQLVEFGGGNGTLMADMLRTFQHFPNFNEALKRIIIVDASPILINQQKNQIMDARLNWVSNPEAIEPFSGSTLCIANEFFDALPIQQFEPCGEVRKIIAGKDSALIFANNNENCREEPTCYQPFVESINKTLALGGATLIIDYGYSEPSPFTSSLQGIRGHKYYSILDNPGLVDITHHVNFTKLAAMFSPAFTAELSTQGEFLLNNGIRERCQALCNNANQEDRALLSTAFVRLTAPQHMGELFKVLTITNTPS